jgi:MerR-like DNA binding protein
MATLSDLARATGAKPRTVQLWADAGVVVPEIGTDHEGPGRHREFSKNEAIVACIVAPFAADKMAISGLIPLARMVRDHLRDKGTKAFDHAIKGVGKNFLVVSMIHFDPVRVTGYTDKLTHAVGTIEGPLSDQPLSEFMSDRASDFPLVRILSLNTVLKPINAVEF